MKQNQIIEKEVDIFNSQFLRNRNRSLFALRGSQIALFTKVDSNSILNQLTDEWSSSIARICISLRRLGTGGSLLISSNPNLSKLDIVNKFLYHRLRDATILKVLDSAYSRELYKQSRSSGDLLKELHRAETDEEDRTDELTGAVKIVTSLAAIDGLVLMDPELDILGFGVKIKASNRVDAIYDGQSLVSRGKLKKVDISELGTRHSSMFRYCAADETAMGFVISQDGNVRFVSSLNGKLALWENVKLLNHEDDIYGYAKQAKEFDQRQKTMKFNRVLGFSKAPKTLADLSFYVEATKLK